MVIKNSLFLLWKRISGLSTIYNGVIKVRLIRRTAPVKTVPLSLLADAAGAGVCRPGLQIIVFISGIKFFIHQY